MKQTINLGIRPLGTGGDTNYTAFTKVNENFTELYSALGTSALSGQAVITQEHVTDSVSTESSTTVASATAVKTAYDLAATKLNAGENAVSASKWQTPRNLSITGDATCDILLDGSSDVTSTLTLANTGVTAGSYGSSTAVGSFTVDAKGRITAVSIVDLRTATTEQTGVVQLNDETNSTSVIQAATANAVKKTYDLANAAIPLSQKAVPNGVATLDASGLIPANQLPSYVDDVLEFTALTEFPTTGETSKIYLALDTNRIYRWSGSTYVEISGSALSDATIKLNTARLIGGVPFDGTADITLPGVNAEGNQNTSGNAATASKLQTAKTIGGVSFDGSSNINLPGVNIPGNQDTSGNAATATKLQTARTFTYTGDATGTLSFDGLSDVSTSLSLSETGVVAGTYPKVTVDAKGRITSGASLLASDIPVLNQDTTGNAATADVAAACTGNSATATKLETIRTINGTGFDGSSNILVNVWVKDVQANTDLNTVQTAGFYQCPAEATVATLTNCPTTLAFSLLVERHSGIKQTLTESLTLTPKTYSRNMHNSVWGDWYRVYTTEDAPTSVSGNAGTATKLQTAQSLTIGRTAKNFDGSEDVSWTLDDIFPTGTKDQIIKHNGTGWVIGEEAAAAPVITEAEVIAGTGTEQRTVTAATLKAAIQTHAPTPTNIVGNAGTATKLQTGRYINGTFFDGTSDIDFNIDPILYAPIPYAKTTPPAGYLMMMGQAISQATYPKLYALYGANLPDLRGVFIRGWDNGRGLDSGRGILTYQSDAIRNITGDIVVYTALHAGNSGSGAFYMTDAGGNGESYKYSGSCPRFNFDASRVVPTAADNRPRNVAFNYIVKAG